MICDVFDLVAVPFPFTDSTESVRRPALVVSQRDFNVDGHTLMAIIRDARNPVWPLDVRIDHVAVGLKMASIVRMKLFTLDNRLIIRKIGALSDADRGRVVESLRRLLPREL